MASLTSKGIVHRDLNITVVVFLAGAMAAMTSKGIVQCTPTTSVCLAGAMAAMTSKGIVHRDLNLMVVSFFSRSNGGHDQLGHCTP
jgi:hypothetical protein